LATRQELGIGNGLIKYADRCARRLWVACHLAQEIHPLTGQPWLYKEPTEKASILTAWPVTAMAQELHNTLLPIDKKKGDVDKFVAKVSSKFIANSVEAFGLDVADVMLDLDAAVVSKSSITSDERYVLDKTKLLSLGEEKVVSDWQIDKIHVQSVKVPESEFVCNCGNDSLDALSFELRNRGEHTGVSIPKKKTNLWMIARCRSALISASNTNHPDGALLAQVANWVLDHKDDDFIFIADYIDANMPKLPLIRRHWSL